MPLILQENFSSDLELGLWEIQEDEIWFAEQLNLTESEEEWLATIKGHRKLEWLAGRWLLHWLSGRKERGACIKDEFGKPYLEGSKFQISISHSRKMVSVAAGPRAVGVDVQQIVGKIARLKDKFLSAKEKEMLKPQTELVMLHLLWGAKEAMYKAYGRKKLDFKEHLVVEPFEFNVAGGKFLGQVRKGNLLRTYELEYQMVEDYVLVYGMEKE